MLQPGHDFYYNAFCTLSSCRSVGMGIGKIPWTAVNDFALRWGLSDIEFGMLWRLISRVDDVYLAWEQKRTKKGATPTKAEEEGRVDVSKRNGTTAR